MKTVTCPVCFGSGRPEDPLWLCRADREKFNRAKREAARQERNRQRGDQHQWFEPAEAEVKH